MILYPAVDIKGGKCVRLRQGEAHRETIFGDPLEMALHWQEQGARFLHVIDLDGSFDGEPTNLEVVRNICSELSIPVQLGGGVRNLSTAERYLEAGVKRIIIGTIALEEPSVFEKMCAAYPDRFGVSLDTADGIIKTRGWVKDTGMTIERVLPRLTESGAAFLIFTDISLDGMQQGVNLKGISHVCDISRIPVIAAGGVTRLEDVQALYPLGEKGLNGIITGRAIYEGTLDFKSAQDWLDAQN